MKTFVLPFRHFSLLPAFMFFIVLSSSCQTLTGNRQGFNNVDAEQFRTLIDNKGNILLDVRTPQEFAEGHIAGAINIDYESSTFTNEISKLDTSQTYNVYCRSGKRSAAASGIMHEHGFNHLNNLTGGILGWKEKGFAVTTE